MLLFHRRVYRAQLSASLIESDSGSEMAENLSHAMDAASDHGCGKVMRAGDHVGNNFGLLRIGDARFEDANDCRRAITDAAEANGFPDHRGILVKSGGPETIRENNDAGSVGTIVLKSMAEKSLNALSVFTLARKSCISGTENAAFSSPMPGALCRI